MFPSLHCIRTLSLTKGENMMAKHAQRSMNGDVVGLENINDNIANNQNPDMRPGRLGVISSLSFMKPKLVLIQMMFRHSNY